MDAVVNAASFTKTFDTPAIQRRSAAIGPHARVAELAQVQTLGQRFNAQWTRSLPSGRRSLRPPSA